MKRARLARESGVSSVTNLGEYPRSLPSVAIVSMVQSTSGASRNASVAKNADLASRPRISRARVPARFLAASSSSREAKASSKSGWKGP